MSKDKPVIAAFSLGWDSACPIIRMTGPCQAADLKLLQGDHDNYPNQIEDADLVIIQRDFPFYRDAYRAVVSKARALGKPIVYETDDLILEAPEELPQYKLYRDARTGVLLAMLEADALITSTDELKNKLNKHNSRVFVLNNCLEDSLWKIRKPKEANSREPVEIAYIGSASHNPDIESIAPTLQGLLKRYGNRISFTFWGVRPPQALISMEGVKWIDQSIRSYSAFIDSISSLNIDIAIAPLKDNEFNRCKSHIKFLEYSAIGVAGVYSDLPPYNRIVRHEENGVLASTPEEWLNGISSLIESPQLRNLLAINAQETLKNSWLMSTRKIEFQQLFNQLANIERRQSEEVVDYVRLVDSWYEELKFEADDLRDLAANLDRSRAWKLLERWWQLRERVGLPASTPPEHRRRQEKQQGNS